MKIQQLLAHTSEVTPVAPEKAAPEGADIIGVLSEELQRLYTLEQNLTEEAQEQLGQAEKGKEPDPIETEETVSAIRILRHIFWHELRSAFGLHGASEVGITEGWQVWVVEEIDCDCPLCSMHRKGGVSVIISY